MRRRDSCLIRTDPSAHSAQVDPWSEEELLACLIPSNGYNRESPAFLHLVNVLARFGESERRQFLQFVTTVPSLPPGGLKSLTPPIRFVLQRRGSPAFCFYDFLCSRWDAHLFYHQGFVPCRQSRESAHRQHLRSETALRSIRIVWFFLLTRFASTTSNSQLTVLRRRLEPSCSRQLKSRILHSTRVCIQLELSFVNDPSIRFQSQGAAAARRKQAIDLLNDGSSSHALFTAAVVARYHGTRRYMTSLRMRYLMPSLTISPSCV